MNENFLNQIDAIRDYDPVDADRARPPVTEILIGRGTVSGEDENDCTIKKIQKRLEQLSEEQAELLHEFLLSIVENGRESAGEESIPPIQSEAEEKFVPVGLYQLFEVLTAQRHELKLFTKANRQEQEFCRQSIQTANEALKELQQLRKEAPEIERKTAKAFLNSLIEMDESLCRAAGALETLKVQLMTRFRDRLELAVHAYCDGLAWWGRAKKRKIIRAFADSLEQQTKTETEQVLGPFIQGFEMLQQRMEDILKKHSIERLNPVNEPVDPETMQVIAVLESDSVPVGHVVDVVRFGYLWKKKPLRFADVRASKK